MSTLAVVEEILRETGVPMSVRQIVEYAAGRLPTKSRTPDTVVARDLSMDIKRLGTASRFARVAPGRYALRSAAAAASAERTGDEGATTVLSAAIRGDRASTLPSGMSSQMSAASGGDGKSASGAKSAASSGKPATKSVSVTSV